MKRKELKQLDLKQWIKQPRRVPSVIQIIPNGCITVGHGETVTIEANFSTQSKEPFTAIWQKLEDGVPRDLILDTDNYNGSSCDLTDLKLVIKNSDHKDAGHYRIEIRSSTESVTSQQVTVRVFGEYPSSLSKTEVNFLLIYLLCQDIGTKAVRILFDRYVPAPTLSAHLQKYKADLATGNYKLQIQKCTSDQWSTLFPADPTVTVSSEKFDLTLLYLLVRSTVNIPRPTQGWGTKPLPSNTRDSDDLERIKQWRNTVVHAKVAETKDSEFNSTWDELSKTINRLSNGHLKTEVDELCNKFKCPTTEFLDCINHVKECLKKQKEEMQQIENRVTEIEEVRHIPKHIRETHLKMIQKWKEEDTVFTEETKLFGSAWNAVVSDSNVNIIFVGGTGSGKTATARHIALKLEQTSDYEIVPVSNPEEISRKLSGSISSSNFLSVHYKVSFCYVVRFLFGIGRT